MPPIAIYCFQTGFVVGWAFFGCLQVSFCQVKPKNNEEQFSQNSVLYLPTHIVIVKEWNYWDNISKDRWKDEIWSLKSI